MTATIDRTVTARTRPAAIGTLRLRLKPAHQKCGYVQGAWWPRSTLLSEELLPLLAALSARYGTIDRVRYHAGDWSSVPVCATQSGGEAVLAASMESPNLVSVSGPDFGELTLLVVPANTDAAHADEVVIAAASANDTSTPGELLADRTSDNRAAMIALHRWESEGGAPA